MKITVYVFYFAYLMYISYSHFNCHYSNLQKENLYEICNLYVTTENEDVGYQLNFFV